MGLRREIKNRLSKMNGRLRRERRRLASVLLCGVMVAGNLSAVPVSALADSDSDNEFTYEIERAALQEALQTAVSEGNTVNEDLEFAGEYAEEYEQFLEADGTLYELEPAIADDDEDRDKALSLRVFARIEGDIPVDSMYEIDGAEEIVFLVSNKTEETVTASIYVDGLETEAITILPADSIPVENESSVVGNTAVTSGTITGGPSGGGSGNGGSGGTAASTSLEIEETEKVTDEVVIEITDTAANDEMSADSAIEDSSVSIVDENDSDSGTQTDENDVTDDEPIENEQTPDDGETADPDTDDRDADAADVDTEDSKEAADDTVDSNTKNEEADAANKESKSEDNTNGDIASNTTDTENTDTSGEADTTSENNTNTTDDGNDGSKEGTAGNNSTSDITEDSDVSVFGSAISVHSSILLATGKATTSDADETASDSDASNAVEGITYESVQLDKKGTAAFATTAADLKLDEVVLVEYMAQENDVTVTVTAAAGALPSGAQLSASMYEEDSEEYAAAGKSVGYDAEDENTGMAAIDITFYDKDGEEVEPLAPVIVSIDVSAIVPENADTSTIEVKHLTETEEGIEPILVADVAEDAEGTVDTETAIAEFEVESFSTFTITWSSSGWTQKKASTSITATAYLYETEDIIEYKSTSLNGTSGEAFDLTSNNKELEIDGYTLVGAAVTYEEKTYTDVTDITITLSVDETGNGKDKTYSYNYTCTCNGEKNSVYNESGSVSGNDSLPSAPEVSIALYYREDAGITILGTGSDSEGYILTATTAGSYDYSEVTWEIENNSVAGLTENSDGTVTVKWNSNAATGDTVTVTASATYTYEDKNGTEVTKTVSDTYTLTNGEVNYTITVKIGDNAVGGAKVALANSDGGIVAYGTTESDGTITFSVLPGEYSVASTYTSGSSIYGYDGSVTVNTGGESNTITLTKQSYTYTHVDIEVQGSYTLKIGETTVELKTYVDNGSAITVVLPDGTVLTDGEYRSGGQNEYNYAASISSQWDGEENENHYTDLEGVFTLSGYVLISVTDVAESGLTEEQIASIFGSYDTVIISSVTNSVPADTYYIIPFSDYHPTQNVCPGQGNGRGYDFDIDVDQLLVQLSEKLIVNKYVINEAGKIISAETDGTPFEFTLRTQNGTAVGSTSLTSGGSYTFENIETGYYYIEEKAESNYVPVSVTVEDNGSITLSKSGYIQYVQTEEKKDGTVASVTYYNLKLDELGVVKLKKSVSESSANGSYSSKTFTFKLYKSDENGKYESIEIAGGEEADEAGITVTTNEDKEFYIESGTYTIVELGSNLIGGDSQTVTIDGTPLTRIVAGDSDPFGLEKDTVYYVGTIEVASGESVIYTVTNSYSNGKNITIKKEDGNNNVLSGAVFTLTKGTETINTYTTEIGTGTVTMKNLADGEYTLTETTAPDGYNLLTGNIGISISGGTVEVSYTRNTETVKYVTYDSDTMTITIINIAGEKLPDTGGPGTTPFRIAGLLLTSCSAYLIYKTLRRKGGWLGG